ncbi:hypothetical protein B0H11DRAFT_2284180 [Mycena galericulata]|nr:hypothetical protein B0H11DRAFT_2284180 [Mycena galericulata]
MTAIPQELIDCIIDEVDDLKSLQACALTAQTFRGPSQRKLFHSLSVLSNHRSPGYSAAHSLLKESPHLATYIKRLTIRLYHNTSRTHWKKLQKVLEKLEGVRWCEISGNYNRVPWNDLTPGLRAAFIHFISRQPLLKLHAYRISGIPPAAFLNAAPSISFCEVDPGEQENLSSVQPWTGIFTSGLIPPKRSDGSISTVALRHVEDLILYKGTEEIYALLVRPEFVSSVKALRRLSVGPQNGNARTLIHAAAQTLEHIHFSSMHNDPFKDFTFLPHLPSLRIFEAVLSLPMHTNVLGIVFAILTSNASPHLVEIVLTYWHFFNWGFNLPRLPDEHTLTELDSALVDHSAAPALRWRLDTTLDDAVRYFGAFTAIVSQTLDAESA